MMKTLYVLPVLMAAGLLAAPGADALTLANGPTVNGSSLNGGSLNGRNINGRKMNGVAVHRTAGEAVAPKAVSVILSDGERITLK